MSSGGLASNPNDANLERMMSSRRRRLAAIALAVLALTLLGWRPAKEAAVSALVVAPNHGAAAFAPVPGEVRVSVGPPAASLSLELVDTEAPRGTVFVLHGIRAGKQWMRGWGEMLRDAGLRAVLVDLRGHGRSTGDYMSYGVVEARDLSQALDELEKRGLVAGKVGAMGTSYGAATAIEWAGIDPRVAAVVAVAPFESLRAVVPGYTPVPLPASFVDRCIDQAGARAGFDPDLASPLSAIGKTRAPVLLFHGREDERIPFAQSERLAAAAPDHAELVLVPRAGHESIMNDETGVIRARAPRWFVEHF
jgi:pimeloyl-ACP methyl ester carboxylesterase